MAVFGSHRFQHPTPVLYADPDPRVRGRTVDGLESAGDGLTVDPVATAAELHAALADAEYACVVTDSRLEETDALSLYERVRSDGVSDVPFVLYTADGDERLASDAIITGFAGYVPRGDDDSIDRLLEAIRRAVRKRGQSGNDEPVDEWNRSERAFQTERDRFRSLFEHIPDAVVLTTRSDDNRILDVNPAFEDVFGYDRSSLVGSPLESWLIPEGEPSIDVYDEVGLEGDITTFVERLTADGPREFLVRGFAVAVGDVIHEYAIYTDVTAQRRRERDLERYRLLVETVGDSMYVLDADGRIEMVNDAMTDALGASQGEIVGAHPSSYMPAEDVERGTETLLEILADDERTWGTFEMRLEPADGEPYLAENNVTPLVDETGAITGSVGVIRDINDQKERERRIRRLHDGTRRLMAAEEPAEVARVASDVGCDALDLDVNSVHLYDEAVDALVPVAATDRTRELLGEIPSIERGGGLAWDAYEAGEAIAHGDVRRDPNVRNPETTIRSEAYIPIGEEGLFIVSSTEPNDFEKEALALANILVANLEAAFERARREDELAARTAELERQNDRLDAFASTVSHDLRNPLTLAAGHLENLESHVDEEGDRDREEIRWALDRMDALIENVLALARSGQRLTETAPTDLDAVVDRAHRTVDPSLEIVRDEPLPTVEADENRLLVLFENVFRNAREHGGEDVTIAIEATDDGFAIADDGPGVPPNEREAILESGYTTAAEGTGFGLAIVTEVVEAHGWSIAVDESAAGGFRLAISLAE